MDAVSRDAILAIPLSKYFPDDCVYWRFSVDGDYTVKSGYWLAKLGLPPHNGNSLLQANDDLWKVIWGMDCPPKLRHFLWSACKGNMAVRQRLAVRHITENSSCPICGYASESTIHSLFECEAASAIWQNCDLATNLTDAPTSSFAARWLWLSKKCNAGDLRKMAALLWAA